MRAWFRFTLLLLVLPLALVFTTTGVAQAAADTPGATVRWSGQLDMEDLSGGFSPIEVTCNYSAQYLLLDGGLSLSVHGAMKCAMHVPFADDPGVGDVDNLDTSVLVMGSEPDNNYCDGHGDVPGDPIAGMTWEVTDLPAECQVFDVCFNGRWDRPSLAFDRHWSFEECYEVDMGPPPVPEPVCPYGQPVFVQLGMMENAASPGTYTHDTMIKFTLVGEETEFASFGTVWKHWSMDIREAAGGVGSITPNMTTGGLWRNGSTTPNAINGAQWIGQQWKTRDGFGQGNAYGENTPPLGAWIWITNGINADPPGDIGRHHNTFTYGQTDAANCHFYFGPEFFTGQGTPAGDISGVNDPEPTDGDGLDIDVDDPVVTPDPEDPNTDCDFKFKDPSTWAGAGICALVGLAATLLDKVKQVVGFLGDIVAALGSLAGDIASAIVDFLESAFVPSDGFLDDRLDRLDSAWSDTSPVKWSSEVSGLTAGAASGCEGVPLDVTLPGNVDVHESLGAACSGSMATIAALVRVVLGAVVVIGGLMACVRAIGSGFGWDPGVGKVAS